MFDDDFDNYDPTEPFSQDEFIVHDDDELDDLDCGEDADAFYREPCPRCGTMMRFQGGDVYAYCRSCGGRFPLK